MSGTNTTAPSVDQFEVFKRVVHELKSVPDVEMQRNILRWTAEMLNLGGVPNASMISQAISQPLAVPSTTEPGASRPPDIKSFFEQKKPNSDIEFAAMVAYYYQFVATMKRESIDAEALQEACRLSGRSRFKRPDMTLNNALNAGYLDRIATGQFRVSVVGENLIAVQLPEDDVGSVRKSARRKKAKSKSRK